MGQAQSFETDHAQLDDIHLPQLNFGALISTRIINDAALPVKSELRHCPFGNKTDVRSSICNRVNCSNRRASEARAAWLRQL